MLIIGSTAMHRLFPKTREPKDLDLMGNDPARKDADVFWHTALLEYYPPSRVNAMRDVISTVDELYTIKVSHSYWELKNGSWEKHIEDAAYLKSKGATLIESLHDVLYKIWEETHGAKKVNLGMESMDFFTDAVQRKYDHDSIHASVAYGERPLYESVVKDGESVAVDMAKIKALPFEEKVKLYREEVYATALERILVPKNYRHSAGAAYRWALRRTITSLTKGWSARFMVTHYEHFRIPDCDYVQRHLDNKDRLILL